MNMIDKQLVRNRFLRSTHSYDQQAIAQQIIANRLLEMLFQHSFRSEKILEVGCGSGFLTKSFLKKCSPGKIILNDLYPIQKQLADALIKTNYQFIEGDAENLVWKDKLDLIITSSTIQWFNNPAAFISNCRDCLLPNGILAFSTFLPGNLQEIYQLTGVGLNYFSEETLRLMLDTDFEVLETRSEEIKVHFPSTRHVLKHLSDTGVTGVSTKRWNKESYHEFNNEYEKLFRTDEGLKLTYTPAYFIARKK